MRKLIPLIIGLPLILFALLWTATHGRLTINLPANSTDAKVMLIDPAGNKTELAGGSHVLSSGTYSIEVSGNSSGWIGIVTVPRFLGSSEAQVSLKPEVSRSFIGNDPGPCVGLIESSLTSYSCGASPDTIVEHMPGNASTPAFVQAMGSTSRSWTAEGIISASNKTYLFTTETGSEDGGQGHYLYTLEHGPKASSRTYLDTLTVNGNFTYVPYKSSGYIAYTRGGIDAFSANDAGQSPQKVQLIQTGSFGIQDASANGDTIALLYTSDADALGSEAEDGKKDIKSQVVLVNGNDKKTIQLHDGGYTHAVVCGTDKNICAISSDKHLDVYTESGDLLYTVGGALEVLSIGGRTVISTEGGVVDMDIDGRSGTYAYSYGNSYTPCGIYSVRDSLLLCIINTASAQKYMLSLDFSGTSDNIDKAIAQATTTGVIKSVAAAGKNIFIATNNGEISYQQSTGMFGYDPATVKANKQAVLDALQKSGVNVSSYNIVIN